MKKIDENTVPHSIKIVAMLKLKKGQSAYASDDSLVLPAKYEGNTDNLEIKL